MQDMIIRISKIEEPAWFAVAFDGAITLGFTNSENAGGWMRWLQDNRSAKSHFMKLAEILERFWDDQRETMTSEELADRMILDEEAKSEFLRLIGMIKAKLFAHARGIRANNIVDHLYPEGCAPENQKVFQLTMDQHALFTGSEFIRVATRHELLRALDDLGVATSDPHRGS